MRTAVLAVLALLLGCSGTSNPGAERTLIVRFTRSPSPSDVADLEQVGGHVTQVIPLAQSAAMRSERPPADYLAVSGVESSDDLGPEEDPLVSVFIEVVDDAPTAEDTTFVRGLGAEGGMGIITIIQPPVIAAVMPLSRTTSLADRARFTGAEIVPTSINTLQ